MIDRYGNEIEADLLERYRGIELRDYFREWGDPQRRSRSQLLSLIGFLQKRPDTYLSDARSRDVEVYRAASEAGALSTSRHRPRSFEMTEDVQLLAGIFKLLQDLVRVTSRDKKYKPKPWPMPETAADLVKREDAQRGYDDLMAEIVFVPQDEFEAHIERHRGEHPEIRNNGDN